MIEESRNAQLRRTLLDSVCNDFESIHQIIQEVQQWMHFDGMKVGEDDIRNEFHLLVQEGLVDPYVLSPTEKPRVISIERIDYLDENLYFLISESGRLALAAPE